MFWHQTVCNARDCAETLNDIVSNLDEGVRITERPSIIRLEHNDDLLITYYEDRPAFVEATESGAPCAITDAARDMPVTSAEIAIPVTQESGTPAPDNYLAFTGYTSVTLTHDDGEGGGEETFAFTFPEAAGTVYGGKLDAISGVLTVTHGIKVFDGTVSFLRVFTGEGQYPAYSGPADFMAGADTTDQGACSLFDFASIFSDSNNYGYQIYQASGRKNVKLRFEDMPETEADMKALTKEWYDAGTPLVILYKLAEPVTYQLDPVAMQTMRGANSFAASIESTVTVGYWADPLLSD